MTLQLSDIGTTSSVPPNTDRTSALQSAAVSYGRRFAWNEQFSFVVPSEGGGSEYRRNRNTNYKSDHNQQP